jgi:hypothetical protein
VARTYSMTNRVSAMLNRGHSLTPIVPIGQPIVRHHMINEAAKNRDGATPVNNLCAPKHNRAINDGDVPFSMAPSTNISYSSHAHTPYHNHGPEVINRLL